MTDNKNIKALDNLYNKISNDTAFLTKVNYGELSALFHVKRLLELQDAEIERLKAPKFLVKKTLSEKELSEMLKKGRIGVIPHIEWSIKRIDEDGIKSEAIKEFAERVKQEINFPLAVWRVFENLVQEMVGESEESSVTQETRKSKWEIACDGYYPYCPNCGEEPPSGKMTNFCPKCGKDMRGDK